MQVGKSGKTKKMKRFLEQSYKGKKVFITGHTGFKGAWLTKILLMLGAEVKAMSLEPDYKNNLYEIFTLDSKCHSLIADICDAKKMEQELISYQPDFIFHLAAQALVRRSYEYPIETFLTNSIGTANLLNALRKLEKPCVSILITTDKVYRNNESGNAFCEEDALGGYDPYSASKACAELVIESYRNSFFNRNNYINHKQAILSLRAGNVIGGGDWAEDRLIPDVVKALSTSTPIILRNPSSVRPWQHVFEPLVAYLILGARATDNYLALSDSYNVGPVLEDTFTVENMVKMAIERWGSGTYKVERNGKPLHEATLLKLDVSKISNDIRWTPKLNAENAIELTIEWYKLFFQNPNQMNEYSEIQINNYFEKFD